MLNDCCCNRAMSIGDDHGDNEATMRCRLPMGHDGPHQETYESCSHGKVTVSFEKGPARSTDGIRRPDMVGAFYWCRR